jgi:E3 ubiquitin-protein ligase DOA10
MKINYLGKEITEKQITVDMLKKLIASKDLADRKIVYNLEFTKESEEEYSACICTISDKEGRRVQYVGDAYSPHSAKKAADEAFLNTAIIFFGIEDYELEEKENLENSNPNENEENKEVIEKDNEVDEDSDPELENVKETVIKTSVSNNEEEIKEESSETVVSVSEESSAPKNEVMNNELTKLGETPITFGKYGRDKDHKHTIAEIYENDYSFITWALQKLSSSTNPAIKPEVDAMKKYHELKTKK